MATVEFEVDTDTIAAVMEPAMTAARSGKEGPCRDTVRARREQFVFMTILATALNLGLRMATDLSDADHAAIRDAAIRAAGHGLGILPPAEDGGDEDGGDEETRH